MHLTRICEISITWFLFSFGKPVKELPGGPYHVTFYTQIESFRNYFNGSFIYDHNRFLYITNQLYSYSWNCLSTSTSNNENKRILIIYKQTFPSQQTLQHPTPLRVTHDTSNDVTKCVPQTREVFVIKWWSCASIMIPFTQRSDMKWKWRWNYKFIHER